MNNDLISREALKKTIKEAFDKANLSEYEACVCVCEIYDKEIDNAPTVEVDNYSMGYQDGVRKVLSERPKDERAERALAIIDRLRTDGHINNKEQGTLRRAILLPERPQGKWYDFIPNCLKARHGEYVLYKVDFLLDNLAREVNIMESARRMKGGAE